MMVCCQGQWQEGCFPLASLGKSPEQRRGNYKNILDFGGVRARLQLLIREERFRNAVLNTLSSSAKLFMKS